MLAIHERFAHRYYDAVTVGIDFTARDWQRRFRQEGKPWELSKGFDGSAAIGEWIPKERFRDVQALPFHLDINGKTVPERFAHRYYDAVTVGIDFTARELQKKLREAGQPWDLCKGFDGAAALGEWVSKEKFRDVQAMHFHLDINGQTVQEGRTSDMIFSIDHIVSYISQFFTLKTGDIIYTGTPVGVGPVHIDDHLEGWVEDRKVLEFNCK